MKLEDMTQGNPTPSDLIDTFANESTRLDYNEDLVESCKACEGMGEIWIDKDKTRPEANTGYYRTCRACHGYGLFRFGEDDYNEENYHE